MKECKYNRGMFNNEGENERACRPKLLVALALACYLAWTDISYLQFDWPERYQFTGVACAAFLVGTLAGAALERGPLGMRMPRNAVAVGLLAGLCNAVPLLATSSALRAVCIAIGALFCGMFAFHWVRHFVTMPKGEILPLIASGGFVAGLLMLAGLAGEGALALELCALPLCCAALGSVVHRPGAGHVDAAPALMRDKYHSSWPLPLAIVLCAFLISVLASLLSVPFAVISARAHVAAAVLQMAFGAALFLWSAVLHRRNTAPFLIVAVIVVEIALVVFATGGRVRLGLPVDVLDATVCLFDLIVWIYASFLARSSHLRVPYAPVFALFLCCGTGFLGRLTGAGLDRTLGLPFAALQTAAMTLAIAIALIMIVALALEAIVVRTSLEREAALQVAQAKDEAAAQLEQVRMRARSQIEEVEEQARQQVARIQARAERSARMSMEEGCAAVCEAHALTKRESEAVVLVCRGLTRADIAEQWVVSENTVKYHLRNVYRKLDVHNAREVIALVEAARAEEATTEPDSTAKVAPDQELR